MKHVLVLATLLLLTVPAQAQVFDTSQPAPPEFLSEHTLRIGRFYTYSDSLGAITDSVQVGTIAFVVRDSLGAPVETKRYNLKQLWPRLPAPVRQGLLDLNQWIADKIRDERSVQ